MKVPSPIESFWRKFLSTLPPEHPYHKNAIPEFWSFGISKKIAHELGQLVREGKKTATTSRFLGDNSDLRHRLSIITDGDGAPLCLVEIYEVSIQKFCEVTDSFAAEEGEGDLSLNHWRESHWSFFESEGKSKGYVVSHDMLVCCSRFRVLYPHN